MPSREDPWIVSVCEGKCIGWLHLLGNNSRYRTIGGSSLEVWSYLRVCEGFRR